MAKDSYYLKFINQALEIAIAIPEFFSRFSKKIFNNHQKLTLLVLKQKLRTTYRDLIELLKITNIPKLIKLKRIPHFTTLIRFSRKLSPLLVRKLISYSCERSKPKNLKLGVDATGLELNRTSEHYIMIKGRNTKQKYILQITACGLMDSMLISSARVGKYNVVRNNNFLPVIKDSAKLSEVDYVTADKGYDSKKNHEYVLKKLKAESYIKIREGCLGKHGNMLRNKVLREFDDEKYHQRSKIETIFSMIKRRYGSSVKAKSRETQVREGYHKILTHNLDRLCKIINQIILGCHQSRCCSSGALSGFK